MTNDQSRSLTDPAAYPTERIMRIKTNQKHKMIIYPDENAEFQQEGDPDTYPRLLKLFVKIKSKKKIIIIRLTQVFIGRNTFK